MNGTAQRLRIAAVHRGTGALSTQWNPRVGARPGATFTSVSAFALSNDTLYVGGAFGSISASGSTAFVPRNHFAAIRRSTGEVLSLAPQAGGTVNALAISGNRLFLGGEFSHFSAPPTRVRFHLAAIDVTTGLVTNWDPSASNAVKVLVISGSTLYVGGDFSSISTKARKGAGAFDVSTDAVIVKDWDPNPSAPVMALTAAGHTVYMGGSFNSLNAMPRAGIAALDVNGAPLPWRVGPATGVRTMHVSGSYVYVGGSFTQADTIGGLHAESPRGLQERRRWHRVEFQSWHQLTSQWPRQRPCVSRQHALRRWLLRRAPRHVLQGRRSECRSESGLESRYQC